MALYHFSAKIVARSRGQSAVASAAYRARTRLLDERLGKTFDYSRRRGLVRTEIMAPDNAPDWMRDREQLWNAVEKAEKRKDSQLARSLDIALPHELSLDHNIELLRGFVQEQFVDKGMIADIAIHAPGGEGDTRNIHAHILLTTREIAGPGFGLKAREWNPKEELEEWRKEWADHANRVLEREGFEERIDHRSLVDQGIDREPTTHIGPSGIHMEQRGKPSDRARVYRSIEAANDDLALLKKELRASEQRQTELRRQLATERMEKIQKTVRAVKGIREQPEAPAPEAEPSSKQPEPPAQTPRRPRPSTGERLEQIQKTVRHTDKIWKEAEARRPPAPEPPPEPEPPPKQPEPSAAQPERPPEPEPPAPAQQPDVPSTTPRGRYAKLIEAQNYAARAKEEEEKQKAGREEDKEKDKDKDKDKEKEKDERERKRDRER